MENMENMENNGGDYVTQLLKKIYEESVRATEQRVFQKYFNDTLFNSLLVSVFCIGLILLSNRFIPVNFMGYTNVQPWLSIAILALCMCYFAYSYYKLTRTQKKINKVRK